MYVLVVHLLFGTTPQITITMVGFKWRETREKREAEFLSNKEYKFVSEGCKKYE